MLYSRKKIFQEEIAQADALIMDSKTVYEYYPSSYPDLYQLPVEMQTTIGDLCQNVTYLIPPGENKILEQKLLRAVATAIKKAQIMITRRNVVRRLDFQVHSCPTTVVLRTNISLAV